MRLKIIYTKFKVLGMGLRNTYSDPHMLWCCKQHKTTDVKKILYSYCILCPVMWSLTFHVMPLCLEGHRALKTWPQISLLHQICSPPRGIVSPQASSLSARPATLQLVLNRFHFSPVLHHYSAQQSHPHMGSRDHITVCCYKSVPHRPCLYALLLGAAP